MIVAAHDWLQPIYDLLRQQLTKNIALHADETLYQILNRTDVKPATSQPRFWVFRTLKTASWIHEQLLQQGFKGTPSSTRRKVQEIKATLPMKKSKQKGKKETKKPNQELKATKFQLISFIWRNATSLNQDELNLLNKLFQKYSDLSDLYTDV